jgi:hypothetical protein
MYVVCPVVLSFRDSGVSWQSSLGVGVAEIVKVAVLWW